MIDALGRPAPGPVARSSPPRLPPSAARRAPARASREANALVRTTVAMTQLGAATRQRARHPAIAHAEHPDRARRDGAVDGRPAPAGGRRPGGRAAGRVRQRPLAASRGPTTRRSPLIGGAVRSVYPDAVVAPYVMVQASDARHFAAVSDSVYRFMPFDLSRAELAALHAADERMSVAALRRGSPSTGS